MHVHDPSMAPNMLNKKSFLKSAEEEPLVWKLNTSNSLCFESSYSDSNFLIKNSTTNNMKGVSLDKAGGEYTLVDTIDKPEPGKKQVLVKSLVAGLNPV
jgi:hypothetical protein